MRLRPVLAPDVDWLYHLSISPEVGWRWRFRGTHPSPDAFAHVLWEGVLCQYVVEDRADGQPLGLVTAHDASQRHGYLYLSAVFRPMQPARSWEVEGCLLFVDHLFRLFPIRKLYLQAMEFNVVQFASVVGSVLIEEARLVDHEFHDGRYWDQLTFSLTRERWLDTVKVQQLLEAVRVPDAAMSAGGEL